MLQWTRAKTAESQGEWVCGMISSLQYDRWGKREKKIKEEKEKTGLT